MRRKPKCDNQDVAAIVTAMTDGEQPFLYRTVDAVLSDPGIGQVVLCVEEKNTWVDASLGKLIQDPRLEIVRMPMAFLGAVRNQALDYVQLPWVAYCDGDDVWCNGKTFRQQNWAEQTDSDFVGTDHYLTNENGKICAVALARHIPMPSSWMVRTEVMKQYPFDGSLSTGEDGEWWVRTSDAIRKVRYPITLLKYRIRSGSLSSNTASKRRKAKIVAWASLPLLREIVLLCTGCIWLFTRQNQYVWLDEWGQ